MSRIYDAVKRAGQVRERKAPERTSPPPPRPSVEGPPVDDRLARRILALPREGRPQVVALTSALHGEGTSTMALRLATALGGGGARKVILVDANLRTPSQHELSGVSRAPGLTEVLTGKVEWSGAVRQEGGCPLLTAGRPAGQPTVLLESDGMRALLAELRSEYAFVILDLPPATVYSDAAATAALADAAILVIRAEKTRHDSAREATAVLEESGAHMLGAVLNRRRSHLPGWLDRRL